MSSYNLAVCGGTFDHLHKGHKAFIKFNLHTAARVLLGITSDAYIKQRKADVAIEPYEVRKNAVLDFLKEIHAFDRVKIEAIDDVHIPKNWEHLPIEAIIVSPDTVDGAEAINQLREKRGLAVLSVVTAPLIRGDGNAVISSKKIREGSMNREGKLFVQEEWLRKPIFLPDFLRKELSKPFDTLLTAIPYQSFEFLSKEEFYKRCRIYDSSSIITVGDIVTRLWNEFRARQKLSVIDFIVERKKKFFSLKELGFEGNEKVISVRNPAGCITPDLLKALRSILTSIKTSERVILKIDGEEDLSVLPILLMSPLHYIIFYGQPGKGMVRIEVTEQTKEKAYNILEKFTI